jgi:hypothetical protein
MKRRPTPQPTPPPPASHVYRWTLDPDGFRDIFGEPSPELLAAVADRDARMLRQGHPR